MNKLIIFITLFWASASFSQNLQVHYDFGQDRDYITTTFEMYKPDALGSTFWFIDMDYNSTEPHKSMSLAYLEIARYFTLPVLNQNLSATIQYNDGFLMYPDGKSYGGASLYSAWLGGFSYFFPVGHGNVSLELLYRHMDVSDKLDGQITLVWYLPFFDGKLDFMGFLDYWSQDMQTLDNDGIKKSGVLSTEPQLWYNINKTIAIGGEVEISRNMLPEYGDEVKVMPTLGIKWTF